MTNKKIENFLLIIIIASILQLFLEEFSIISSWPIPFRHLILYFGLAFDAIFSVEFIIKLFQSYKNKKVKVYILYQRGWIDFLASVPLLVFYSLPMVYYVTKITQITMINSMAAVNVFKLVRLIRISRILRLLRVLKIFGKISKSAAKMLQHHIATIATTTLASLIIGLLLIRLIFFAIDKPGVEIFGHKTAERYQDMIGKAVVLSEKSELDIQQALFYLFLPEDNILNLTYKGESIRQQLELDEILSKYAINDLEYVEKEGISIWFHISDVNQQIARNYLEIFLLVLFILAGILIFYSKHFLKHIALPIDTLQQKITDPSYKPKLDVNQVYENDEIYSIMKLMDKKDNSPGGY